MRHRKGKCSVILMQYVFIFFVCRNISHQIFRTPQSSIEWLPSRMSRERCVILTERASGRSAKPFRF
jgi:hypothetical protein